MVFSPLIANNLKATLTELRKAHGTIKEPKKKREKNNC